MSKHRQQSWVAPRPEKHVTPANPPPALTEQEPDVDPGIAFSAPPLEDLPPDTSYFGAAGAVPDTKLPLKHDRITKAGVTYIVVGVNDGELKLMGPLGVETVPTSNLGEYTR